MKKDRKAEIEKLKVLYAHLLEQTFSSGLSGYLSSIDRDGCIYYDECRFYPKEGTIHIGKRVFVVQDSEFFRGSRVIQIKKKNQDTDAPKRSRGQSGGFMALTDPDVILYLLEHYFGIKWE